MNRQFDIRRSPVCASYCDPVNTFLGEFKARHPGIVPQLIVAHSEAVQARVAERSLDLGFIEGDSHLPTLVTESSCGFRSSRR